MNLKTWKDCLAGQTFSRHSKPQHKLNTGPVHTTQEECVSGMLSKHDSQHMERLFGWVKHSAGIPKPHHKLNTGPVHATQEECVSGMLSQP